MKIKNNKIDKYDTIAYLILFIVLTTIYFFIHKKVFISSDSTSTYLMSKDVLAGNIFLKGWVLGSNNFYFTEIIPYAIGTVFFISPQILISLIPSIAYAGIVVCILRILKVSIIKEYNLSKIVFLSLYFSFVGILAYSASYTLLNANSHNNLYDLILLYLLIFIKYIETKKLRYLFINLFIGSICSFSEGVTNMVLFAPLFVYCLIYLFISKQKKEYIFSLINLIAAFTIAKILKIIFVYYNGMIMQGFDVKRDSVREIIYKIYLYINQIGVFFNNDRMTSFNDFSFKTIIIYASFLLFIIGIILSFFFIKKLSYGLILFISAIINIVLCIATNVPPHHRYSVVFFIFGAAVTAYTFSILISNIKSKFKFILATIFITISILFSYFKINIWVNVGGYYNQRIEVINKLKEENVKNEVMYGDFWSASVLEYYSDYKMKIYPIKYRNNKLIPHDNLLYIPWYEEKNVHYIITNNDDKNTFSKEELSNLLGKPEKVIKLTHFTIYHWKEDISKFVEQKNGEYFKAIKNN